MYKVCWKHACFKTWSSSWTTTPKLSQHDEVDPLQCPLTGCLCTSPKVEVNTQFLPSKPEAEGWVGPLTCTERSSPQGALTVCWLSRLVGENSKTSMEQRTWGWRILKKISPNTITSETTGALGGGNDLLKAMWPAQGPTQNTNTHLLTLDSRNFQPLHKSRVGQMWEILASILEQQPWPPRQEARALSRFDSRKRALGQTQEKPLKEAIKVTWVLHWPSPSGEARKSKQGNRQRWGTSPDFTEATAHLHWVFSLSLHN